MKFIASVSEKDNTCDPRKLTPMARRFHDPADMRIALKVVFKGVPLEFVNLLIRKIDSGKGLKALIPEQVSYIATFKGEEHYGHDLDLEYRFTQLPISQRLEVGTVFKLSMENTSTIEPVASASMYAMTILSEHIKSVKPLPKKLIPFNRRVLIGTLMPTERIHATLVVREAAERYSVRRRTWWSRPTPLTLVVETQLDDHPANLLMDIAEDLLATFDQEPYLEKILADDDMKKEYKKYSEKVKD